MENKSSQKAPSEFLNKRLKERSGRTTASVLAPVVLQLLIPLAAGGSQAAAPSQSGTSTYLPANRETYLRLAKEVETMLRQDVLEVGFRAALTTKMAVSTQVLPVTRNPVRAMGNFPCFRRV